MKFKQGRRVVKKLLEVGIHAKDLELPNSVSKRTGGERESRTQQIEIDQRAYMPR